MHRRGLMPRVATAGGAAKPHHPASSASGADTGSTSPASTVVEDAAAPVALLCTATGSASVKGRFHANEDRHAAVVDLPSCTQPVTLLLVCDGHDGGACASMVQAKFGPALAGRLACTPTSSLAAALSACFTDMECAWIAHVKAARGRGAGLSSGACVTAVAIQGSHIVAANVGDCRAILRRPSGAVEVLTSDHRVANEAERRRITEAGGVIRNGRVCGVLEPTRTIGDLDEKASSPPGVISIVPDVSETDVPPSSLLPFPSSSTTTVGTATAAARAGRIVTSRHVLTAAEAAEATLSSRACFLIIATDGVWDFVTSKAAAAVVAHVLTVKPGDAHAAAHALVNYAARCGSLDDITATVVIFHAV